MKNLYIKEEFIHEFQSRLKDCVTYEDAYDQTEEACIAQNGRRRYKNWETFRQILYRYLRSRNSNRKP